MIQAYSRCYVFVLIMTRPCFFSQAFPPDTCRSNKIRAYFLLFSLSKGFSLLSSCEKMYCPTLMLLHKRKLI